MKFIEVKEYPNRIKGTRYKNKVRLEEFMNMNIKIALVDFDTTEYKNLKSARESLYASVKKFGYPIDLVQRKDELYFVRKDM